MEDLWAVYKSRSADEPIIDFIVLAEFDIDSGSTIRHCYPSHIPNCRDDWLAENMLPEGVHNREHDWTYLFINRDAKQIDQNQEKRSSIDANILETDSSLSFLYGLNLVRTKYDSNVRRGAIVKAMAVFSRFHFIEICKGALLLSLDRYFDNPSSIVLEDLHRCLLNLRLDSIPYPNILERQLMRRALFVPQIGSTLPAYLPHNWLYSDTVKLQFSSSTITTTTVTAISTTETDGNATIDWSEDDTGTGSGTGSSVSKENNALQQKTDFTIPISIPLSRGPDEVGDISLSMLVRTFGSLTMRIFHAILTKRKVLFVGHNQCAGDMAQMVLSAVTMVSPPIPGVIRRAFPYCCLSDLSFLEVDGYIAAVTNPMFAQRDSWWDIVCTVEGLGSSGTVLSADEKRSADAVLKGKQIFSRVVVEHTEHEALDAKFIAVLIAGLEARLGEDWVQGQFHDYTFALLLQATDGACGFDIANLEHIKLSDTTKKVYLANVHRASILSNTSEVKNMPLHPWDSLEGDNVKDEDKDSSDNSASTVVTDKDKDSSNPSPSTDKKMSPSINGNGVLFRNHVRRLQLGVLLDDMNAQQLFEDLDRFLRSESACQALVSLLPECFGGISTLALGLFHGDPTVRLHASRLLQRLESFPTIRPLIDGLNPFYKEQEDNSNDNGNSNDNTNDNGILLSEPLEPKTETETEEEIIDAEKAVTELCDAAVHVDINNSNGVVKTSEEIVVVCSEVVAIAAEEHSQPQPLLADIVEQDITITQMTIPIDADADAKESTESTVDLDSSESLELQVANMLSGTLSSAENDLGNFDADIDELDALLAAQS
eukprot:gene3594-7141_t